MLDQAYAVITIGPDGHLASAKCEQLEMKYRMRCAHIGIWHSTDEHLASAHMRIPGDVRNTLLVTY